MADERMSEEANVGDYDTTNRFLVAAMGSGVALMMPPRPGQVLTRDEALNLAAYLVALADVSREHFDGLLDAVVST